MYQAGLILEGGGMKGLYTAGVLDYFLEKNLEFSHGYGVSAGASCLCSYLSKQKGRNFHVFTDYINDRDYCSKYSLLTTGNMFNVKMLYDFIPNVLIPFDFKTYRSYKGKAYAVVTNIKTGLPEYLPMKDMQKDMDIVRASCSLPLISQNVEINGNLYLDGGISDSIPIRRSIYDGNLKNVVILTKEVGFYRTPSSHLGFVRAKYLHYPKVYELMKNRHLHYNETLDFIEQQVKEGQAFVIRPQYKSPVSRIEHDEVKLEKLYQSGYEDAKAQYEDLIKFLEAPEKNKESNSPAVNKGS